MTLRVCTCLTTESSTYEGIEETGDDDDVVYDGHQFEGDLYAELDVDENRREPVLKTVVVLAAITMVFLGCWTHCRGHDSTVQARNDSHGPHSGRHRPVPMEIADEDEVSVAASSIRSTGSKTEGWTLDIFALAASRLSF